MLLSWKQIAHKLVCPACKQPLAREQDDTLVCRQPECGLSEDPCAFAVDQPILVNFEESILDREQTRRAGAVTLVGRQTAGYRSVISRVFFGSNTVAPGNESEIMALSKAVTRRPTILVVGGGTRGSGTGKLYDDPDVDTVAFDVYASDNTSFVADAHDIPLATDSVDAVWIQAVLEHVLTPTRVVDEIKRVLKPGGLVYSETPFMQHVHEGPYDFTRYTHSGHRWLFRDFEEIRSGAVAGAGTQLLWSVGHFSRTMTRSRAVGLATRILFSWLRLFDRFGGSSQTIDCGSGFYFLGRQSDNALSPSEIVGVYRGAQRRK